VQKKSRRFYADTGYFIHSRLVYHNITQPSASMNQYTYEWYQPCALEEAYGVYLLQTVFQLFDCSSSGSTALRISGRLAVPFLSRSGLDRCLLRDIWAEVDPSSLGYLTSRHQFFVLLRLTALGQAGLLQQRQQATDTTVIRQCFSQTLQQAIPLAVFDSTAVPDAESLMRLYGPQPPPQLWPTPSSNSFQQQPHPAADSSSIEDAFGSLVDVLDAPLPSLLSPIARNNHDDANRGVAALTASTDDADDDFGDFSSAAPSKFSTSLATNPPPHPFAVDAAAASVFPSPRMKGHFLGQHASSVVDDPFPLVGKASTTATATTAPTVDVDSFEGFRSTVNVLPSAAFSSNPHGDGEGNRPVPAHVSDPALEAVSGWEALDALTNVVDAPLPILSSQLASAEDDHAANDFGDFEGITTTSNTLLVLHAEIEKTSAPSSDPPLPAVSLLEKGNVDSEFGDFEEGTVQETQDPALRNSSFELTCTTSTEDDVGVFGWTPERKEKESTGRSTAVCLGHAASVEETAENVGHMVPPQRSFLGDFGTTTSHVQPDGELLAMTGQALSRWDALDAISVVQDAPLPSLEALSFEDPPPEEESSGDQQNNPSYEAPGEEDFGDFHDGDENNATKVDPFVMMPMRQDNQAHDIARNVSGEGDSGDDCTDSRDEDKQNATNIHSYETQLSQENETLGFSTASAGGDFESNRSSVYRTGESDLVFYSIQSRPFSLEGVASIPVPRREVPLRADSAYYSSHTTTESMLSEDFFEDAREIEQAEAITATPPLFTSFGTQPSFDTADDPFSAFDSLAPSAPALNPLSSLGMDEMDVRRCELVDPETEGEVGALGIEEEYFGGFVGDLRLYEKDKAADALGGFVGSLEPPSLMSDPYTAARQKHGNDSVGDGFADYSSSAFPSAGVKSKFAPPSSVDGYDLFDDFVAVTMIPSTVEESAAPADVSFGETSIPQSNHVAGSDSAMNLHPPVAEVRDQNTESYSFGDFGDCDPVAVENVIPTASSAPIVQATEREGDYFAQFGSFAKVIGTADPTPMDEISPTVAIGAQDKNDGNESFGDFSDFTAAAVIESPVVPNAPISLPPGQKHENERLTSFASVDVAPVSTLSNKSALDSNGPGNGNESESFGDFGDFSTVAESESTFRIAPDTSFATNDNSVSPTPNSATRDVPDQSNKSALDSNDHQGNGNESESFGDFGDFSTVAESENTCRIATETSLTDNSVSPTTNRATRDVPDQSNRNNNESSFGEFATFDDFAFTTSVIPSNNDDDRERTNLLSLRDFVKASSLQLPEAILRKHGSGGERQPYVDFNEVFDANIGMEVPVLPDRKLRIQRCIEIVTVLSSKNQSKLASKCWEQALKVTRDELSAGLAVLQEAVVLANTGADLKLLLDRNKSLQTYFLGLGEFVRVSRSIVATIGDLLMLDPVTLLTVDTLSSSWCSIVLLKDYIAIEQQWTSLQGMARTVGLDVDRRGSDSTFRLESLIEIRSADRAVDSLHYSLS
jgi:hypothetical protein